MLRMVFRAVKSIRLSDWSCRLKLVRRVRRLSPRELHRGLADSRAMRHLLFAQPIVIGAHSIVLTTNRRCDASAAIRAESFRWRCTSRLALRAVTVDSLWSSGAAEADDGAPKLPRHTS